MRHQNPPRLHRFHPQHSWWLVIIALIAAMYPTGTSAHERWFTPEGPYWTPEWDRFFTLPVLFAVISGGVVVSLLAAGQRAVNDPLWPRPVFFQRMEVSAPAILGVQTAITIIFAATRLELFAPNIDMPENVLGYLLAAVAIIASFSFITGVLTRWGAIGIICLWVISFTFTTWYETLEQFLVVGIALYLVAVGRGVVRYGEQRDEDWNPWVEKLRPHALEILRIAAGVTVLVLAFTEKLLSPDLGVAFLQEYPHFNIAQELGFDWFIDRRFVFAAGIVEATAGFALLSGYLTRVTILLLWIPFNLGIAFLPPQELIGHLPILSTMYVLLVRGSEGIPAPHDNRHSSKTTAPTPTGP